MYMMKNYRYFLTLAAMFMITASLAAGHAYAYSCDKGNGKSSGGHGPFSKHFSDMDTNGDDTMSFEEFKTVFPSTEQKGFKQLDGDQDGTLSHDEWNQFKKMHNGMGMHHKQKYHKKDLPAPSKFNAHFPDMDRNNNDRVTFEEFNSNFPDASGNQDVFKAIDLDGNGELTHEEWHEFKAAHGLKHMD